MKNTMQVGNWNIEALEDEDGHLNVYLKHADGSQIVATNSLIGNGKEWAERFTTEIIEKEYAKSLEDDQFLCPRCLKAHDIEDSIEVDGELICVQDHGNLKS